MNTFVKTVFVYTAFVLTTVYSAVAQSIGYSGEFCVGSPVEFYIRNSSSCIDASVPGMSSWRFSHPPSSITYPNISRYDRVRATWNYPVSGIQVSVSYTCPQMGMGGTATLTGLIVNAKVTPSVTLSIPASVCRGSSVQMIAAPTQGGSSPSFQYKVDGIIVYSGPALSYTIASASLSAGIHNAQVVMSSTASCATPRTVSSIVKSFTVQEKANYSVTVSGPTVICSGTQSVVVKSSVSGTTGNLTYEWFVNGIASPGGSSKTVTVSEGTQVYCKVSSDQWCTNSPRFSKVYTIHVTPSITPVASIKVTKLTWCPGETMILSATNSVGGGMFNWTLNGSSISTSSSVAIPVAASSTTGSFYPGSIVAVRISGINGTCLTRNYADASVGPSIVINPLPIPTFTSGPTAVCQGTDAMYVTQAGMSNYQWTTSGGATILSGGGLANNSITVGWPSSGSGSIAVRYKGTNGCTANTSTVRSVAVAAKPTVATAGVDQSGSTTCGRTSIALTGNTPVAGTGQWTIQSGSGGVITSFRSPTSTFTGVPGTPYVLRWSISNGSCPSTYDDVSILLNKNPSISDAGVDITGAVTCGQTSIALSANTPSSGSATWSIMSGSGGSLSGPSNPKAIFTGLPGSTYILKWTISAPYCGLTSDDVSIKFNSLPSQASAGVDIGGTATCGLTSVSLNGNTPTKGVGAWTVVAGAGGSFNSSTNPRATFTGMPSVTYTLRWTVSNLPCSASYDDVNVKLNAKPAGMPSVTGNARFGPGTLNLKASGAVTGEGYQWKTLAGQIQSTSQTFQTPAISTSANDYTRLTIVGSNGCVGSTVPVNISIYALPVILADHDNVFMGKAATLTVGQYDSYRWMTEDGSVLSTQPQLRTRQPGVYTVTVTRTGALATSSPFSVKGQFDNPFANAVSTNRISVKGISDLSIVSQLTVDSASQNVQYLDGLGRPIQSVVTQSSPLRSDMVTLAGYDLLGREPRKYLPLTFQDDGRYKTGLVDINGALTGHAATFYSNPLDKITDDLAPFSESVFERSPLTRIEKQGAPGVSWQPRTRRTVSISERTNRENEILLFKYDPISGLISLEPANGRYYSAHQLLVTTTLDEDARETIAFTDKNGRVVCKKVKAGPRTYASTYFIYDKLGNLVVILPPEATRDESLSLQHRLDAWGFHYRYDSRRRMIARKVPGADTVFMVYDGRDRLVLSQDGNQRRSNLWTFTKYDELDRAILTGMIDTTALSQTRMQGVVDDYYRRQGVIWGESKGGPVHGYTNLSYPIVNDLNKCLTVTWYDDYSYAQNMDNATRLEYTIDIPGEQEVSIPIAVGLVTGSKVKVLNGGPWGGSQWLCSSTYYDERLRPIQTVSDNLKGKTDRTTFVLDFVGKVLKTKTVHRALVERFGSSTPAETTRTIIRRMTYDHAGRLTSVRHRLDNNPEVILSAFEYNELGQLVTKKLHSTDGAHFLQHADQSYHIRGWLTGINGTDNFSAGVAPPDLFGFDLLYDKQNPALGNSPMYSGNIAAMTWTNDLRLPAVKNHGYIYAYDTMGRLRAADFKTFDADWRDEAQFDEREYQYDQNGNIKGLKRNGADGLLMDNLRYEYGSDTARSNQLKSVTDEGDKSHGFSDVNSAEPDYTYDPNGNLLTDRNKGITTDIAYNFLNLPEKITRGSNSIRYIYDATGKKLSTIADYVSSQIRNDYVGDFLYENDVLQSIAHEEGRITLASREAIYHNDGDYIEGISATAIALTLVSQNNDQTYIKASTTTTGPTQEISFGIFPVSEGERYIVRIKGYRTGGASKPPKVFVKIDGSDHAWPGSALPDGPATESWIEQTVVVPQNGHEILFGVRWTDAPTIGDTFLLNDIELIQITASNPEYQYNYKDHLGNVRMTFTSRQETDAVQATLEPATTADEQSEFRRYGAARKVLSHLFDHTHGNAPSTASGYAQRLNGSPDERVGLAKSLSVMPGDTIRMEVFAKYVDPNRNEWTAALTTLMGYVLSPLTAPGGTILDGNGYAGNGQSIPPWATAGAGTTDNGMKAGLTYIMFDKNMEPVFDAQQTNVVRLSSTPREYGQDVMHERLYAEIIAKQGGYLYVYLANDSDTPVEVYFDDFKVEHAKGPVVQTDEYYPFGLAFNHSLKENELQNRHQFNGKEIQDQLDLGWLDYGARMYQPDIARWGTIDPMSEKMRRHSPYNYAFDNPIRYIDPDGMAPEGPGDDPPGNIIQHIRNQFQRTFDYFAGNASGQEKTEAALRMALPVSMVSVSLRTMSNLVDDGNHEISKQEYIDAATDVATFVPAFLMGPEGRAASLRAMDDRVYLARGFYEKSGFAREKIQSHLNAINFDKSVRITALEKGTVVQQWVGKRGVGNYFTTEKNGSKNLGIEYNDRTLSQFTLTENVEVLESTTAKFNGNRGGGIQYFSVEMKNKIAPIDE
jgi:RHS repeat-associated protein